jgi:hypothetical protein|tara:strand:- start:612 stop:914 length:303 start_codon:yes stop_codon:yes gene_type:complete
MNDITIEDLENFTDSPDGIGKRVKHARYLKAFWSFVEGKHIFVDSMRGLRLISHMLVKRKFLFLNQTECEPSAGPNLKSFGDASRSRTGRQDVVLSGEKK